MYLRKWANVYKQWEFWALVIGVLGAYFILNAAGLIPSFIADNGLSYVITTALIMLPMPYIMRRKEERLAGKDDWFMRLLKKVRAGKGLPIIAAILLAISVLAFLAEIFVDIDTGRKITGIELLLKQPLMAVGPLLYAISAVLALRDYKKWHITAALWTVGGYFALWATILAFTNTDAELPADSSVVTTALALIAPLISMGLYAIPPKLSPLSRKKRG